MAADPGDRRASHGERSRTCRHRPSLPEAWPASPGLAPRGWRSAAPQCRSSHGWGRIRLAPAATRSTAPAAADAGRRNRTQPPGPRQPHPARHGPCPLPAPAALALCACSAALVGAKKEAKEESKQEKLGTVIGIDLG